MVLAEVRPVAKVRVVPADRRSSVSIEERLRLFDESTARQRKRNRLVASEHRVNPRGWTRDDLYARGSG